ncbi:MAG TPA: TMEM175 family protein [Elusimicrobiota bacterium]|nr:TMEM175 family protein [Elusimicrobiota bacterium]
MGKQRLEAFSDGVLAIIITIMVLELRAPEGLDWSSLRPLLPVLLSYVLSYVYIGIYWSNHHHMLHAASKVNGRILWANLHLLFWLSLVPFTTRWLGQNFLAALPVALYGFVLLMAGVAYYLLARALTAHHGKDSALALALGKDVKGLASIAIYAVAIALAFYDPRLANALYVAVALMWIVPDRRIEDRLAA